MTMSDNYFEVKDVPQIPWAKNVKVTGSYIFKSSGVRDSVELAIPTYWMKASVISNGQIHLEVDSKRNIGQYMSKSPELEKSIFKYFKRADYHPGVSSFISEVVDWVKGEPFTQSKEYGSRPGVLDWVPGMKQLPQRIGRIGSFDSGKVKTAFDDWIGSPFSYVHFVNQAEVFPLAEADDGLVILWGDKGKPEVYTGDVEGFMFANQESFSSWESYRDWNDTFENGFLWALDYMGVFEQHGQVAWAVDMIENDPDLMWPELVQKLLPIRKQLPVALETSLMVWMERRQVEADEAAGQRRFWPRGLDA